MYKDREAYNAYMREYNKRWRKTKAGKRMTARYRGLDKVKIKTAEWRKQAIQKRVDLLNAIKLARGCADCGYAVYPEALDFDHVHGQKSFGISKARGDVMLVDKLLEEIKKCVVVCANCHRHRTQVRLQGPRQ